MKATIRELLKKSLEAEGFASIEVDEDCYSHGTGDSSFWLITCKKQNQPRTLRLYPSLDIGPGCSTVLYLELPDDFQHCIDEMSEEAKETLDEETLGLYEEGYHIEITLLEDIEEEIK